jgi:3-phenylpropionate/trans-cinnamate dioxygenase ferredoxin subunit
VSWHDVIACDEVPEGEVRVVVIENKRIAVCHPVDGGQFYAIADVCTHDGGPLDQGELIGTRIECPRHGAQFEITSGRAVVLPAVRPVKTYPVRVNDSGRVEIEVA